MKLLTSPILTEEDINAMKLGYKMRNEIISKNLMGNLLLHDNDVEKSD